MQSNSQSVYRVVRITFDANRLGFSAACRDARLLLAELRKARDSKRQWNKILLLPDVNILIQGTCIIAAALVDYKDTSIDIAGIFRDYPDIFSIEIVHDADLPLVSGSKNLPRNAWVETFSPEMNTSTAGA